ncbi:thiazole synthase [Campylobacter upsaliensis]|uniref:thiazole synthase n=1 Tax=Campylobacter upsaliensis TaxID=28080 RepID=UPI001280863D|nr:thiazole synthase [Campylobacter upsaliensis]EAH5903333.1 thiazole synthase [Campylobacter upsaliensis]EAH5981920.1 thiazole synthase [Campylobacter upsaliensis]EAH6259877.1 thiazole synthase [Campylobacter upsaliensis]EAH7984476.1 thiazole synthase [Campylobacter upsaliensis]EAH9379589.1 thiazole synthase [Campylobacter upsaliensis]
MQDLLKIGRFEFQSRFILGSGKYSLELINSAIKEARAEMITLALRRVNANGIENILDFIPKNITLLPNTSGARNAEEALRIARLARELCGAELIKIEVIRDSKYLLPDNYESIKAVELLAKDGFTPLPYMSADLYVARAMCDAGAAAIMPLAAPIGSNKGLCAREFIQILLNEINLPIIVDAGLGTPAQACEAMQMGVAAVMLNTALAEAKNIPLMARAFALAVEAGRAGYLAGLAKESEARASSPLTGFLRD